MGFWSDIFDPFDCIRSEESKKQERQARAKGRSTRQSTGRIVSEVAESVNEERTRAANAKTKIDPWTKEEIPTRTISRKPTRQPGQTQAEYDEALRQHELLNCKILRDGTWPYYAWGLGIAYESEIPEGARFSTVDKYERGWMGKNAKEVQDYRCSANYEKFHDKRVEEHKQRMARVGFEWTEDELAGLERSIEAIEKEKADINDELNEIELKIRKERTMGEVSSVTEGIYDEKLEIKRRVDRVYDLMHQDLDEAREGILVTRARKQAEIDAKAAEKVKIAQAPEAMSQVRRELIRRSRDQVITHNDEIKKMNAYLHEHGARGCVVGAGPRNMRIVTPDSVSFRDKRDAKRFNQDLDFGD